MREKRTCSIEGCDRPVHGRGWCSKHYQRWMKRGGDPAVVMPPHGMAPTVFPGDRYGRLVVVAEVGRSGSHRTFTCSCDCGETTVVDGGNLRSGSIKSCGCLRRDMAVVRMTAMGAASATHGHTRNGRTSPTYNTWAGMLQRCTDPKHKNYADYGGRGITVCDRWSTFDGFLQDMGVKPLDPEATQRKGTPVFKSLDRIDNDGPYTKANCKWSTQLEQVANQRPKRARKRSPAA